MPDALASYTYDPAIARYRSASGRPVDPATIRFAVEAVIAGAQADIRSHCERLAGGALDIPTWQQSMATTIRALHTATAAAGKGGWDQMTPADWGRVGALTKRQYGWLAGFAVEVQAGHMTAGQLTTRALMYGDAALLTYEQSARMAADAAPGLTEESNRLGPADHCDDCLAATAAGWVPIGTLTAPGSRQCRTRCKCSIGYR